MLIVFAAATVASAAGPPAHLRMAAMEPQAACKAVGTYEISEPALLFRDDGKAKLSQLDELPKANHEKAVVRMVGPCAVPLVVRYKAGR